MSLHAGSVVPRIGVHMNRPTALSIGGRPVAIGVLDVQTTLRSRRKGCDGRCEDREGEGAEDH